MAISLTLGACAERQPGQAQDHLNGGTPSQEQAEPTGEPTGAKSEDPKQENADTNTDKGDADQKGAEQTDAAAHDDSASTQKANPIDSLRKELSAAQTSIKDLNTKVAQLKAETSDNYLYVVITFILAVIGVATAFVNFFTIRNNYNVLNGRIDHRKNDIQNLKSKIEDQQSNNNRGASHASTELQQLKQRVATLESQLLAAQRGAQSTTTTTPTSASASKQPSQHAFFPAPTLNGKYLYFPKLSSTREMAFFEAEVTGSIAIFRPCVSLQNITSNDSLNYSIEFDGVSKSEARGMVVRTDGQAELRGGKWYVTRRVAIRLTK